MTYEEKKKLIAQVAKLAALRYEVEAARGKLRRLVYEKVPCDSDRMWKALVEFQKLDTQWKRLKQEHLPLRYALQEQLNGAVVFICKRYSSMKN